jgi:anthranilate/para-aminobenzoate synthase component II
VFAGLAASFQAGRYHSLIVDEKTLPGDLEVTARTKEDGLVMGLRHRTLPIHGVQFHPESVLTGAGRHVLKNFLEL